MCSSPGYSKGLGEFALSLPNFILLRVPIHTRSPVATVLMTRGTLSTGIPLLAGTSWCSTRRLLSSSLQPVASAAPGTPVLVTGWKSLPSAGEEVLGGSEADVKKARANRERKRDLESALGDVEAINVARKADKEREEKGREGKRGNRAASTMAEDGSAQEVQKEYLRIVVKGDVSGSVEALVGAVKDIGNHLAGVKVVSTGVGDVSDSDVMMAKAADGKFTPRFSCVHSIDFRVSNDSRFFCRCATGCSSFRLPEPRPDLYFRHHLSHH